VLADIQAPSRVGRQADRPGLVVPASTSTSRATGRTMSGFRSTTRASTASWRRRA